MDEQRRENTQQEQQPAYAPRPKWHVWAARIGLAVFIAFLVMYYLNIFRGGA